MADVPARAGRVMIAISVGLALFAGLYGGIGVVIALRTASPWQPALLTTGLMIAAVLQLWKGWTGLLVLVWGLWALLAVALLLDSDFTPAMAAVPLAGFVCGSAGWWQRRKAAAEALREQEATFE